MKEIDYYDKNYLLIQPNTVWYRFYRLLLTAEGTSGEWSHVDNTFLYRHFRDVYNPTENEIILFDLVFGEGIYQKIKERIF